MVRNATAKLTAAGAVMTAVLMCGSAVVGSGDGAVKKPKVEVRVGIEMLFDVNQVNYSDVMMNVVTQSCMFKESSLTYDLADPSCDYVLRGDFYTTGFGSGSRLKAQMEVYQKGGLLRIYDYDIRISEWGLNEAIERLTRTFLKEWVHDFFRVEY